MIVIEPGHTYEPQTLDSDVWDQYIAFVKREGEGYPGNVGHHPGTIIQELLRICIDRLEYLDKQIPCLENKETRYHLKQALWWLESRAARRHNRILRVGAHEIASIPRGA